MKLIVLLKSFTFTRHLLSILFANYFVFVILYLLHAPVYFTTPIYLICYISLFLIFRKIRFRKTFFYVDKASIALLVLFLILLTVPRVPYLTDWLPGNSTIAHSDDFARMLEILAMTDSPQYPLVSPSNNNYLFSFYYSSFFPFAVLKLSIPFLTIKESIAIGNFLYHFLILMSLYEIAHLILRDKKKIRIFIFLCTLFGGFDWLISPQRFSYYGHFENWQRQLHGNTQISSFYTGAFWTIHHFLSAYTVVLMFAIMAYTHSFKKKCRKISLVFLGLISSFYASPFAFASVPFFFLGYIKYVREILRHLQNYIIIIISLLPLPIFLHKLPGQTFCWSTFRLWITNNFFIDKIISFPLYIFIVPIIEYSAIPIMILLQWKNLNISQKKYIVASWLFFISTYFIAYSGANNYSMRGMFIPTFVFFFVFAQQYKNILKKKFKMTCVALILLSIIGTVKEFAGRTHEGIKNAAIFSENFIFSENNTIRPSIYQIATNKKIKKIKFEDANSVGRRNIYNFEKFIINLQINKMERWEKELLRKPY